ncbi:hypothetical protein MTP99_015970 [Tenebrio molitor]|nr:hypothetical protein MTP99_015970 [Tenebrio molitor]
MFLEEKPTKLLYPSQTRWLSLKQVCSRILEHWPSLFLFFQKAALGDDLPAARTIFNALQNDIFKADRRKYEHPLISLAAEDIPQVTGTIPGGSRLHQVVPLYIVATPAVWRPTTAEKRDWHSRHTATDRRQIASRDVTTGSDSRKVSFWIHISPGMPM